MARGAKKEKALTPEEKLAQALVPEAEQPYRVPENWRWVRLGGITEIVGGGTPSSNVKEYYENGSISWISPADLSNYSDIYISRGAKSITQIGLEKSSARLLPKDSVCLSTRAPIGYVAIAQNPLCTNQGFKSFLPCAAYYPEYLYWYLKGNKELLESRASGTTFLELSGSKAAQIEFPLPPLPEQQRIVDRIESLFAKLDEAKEKAQAVVDGFEDRKAVILHKAFTGELTAEWRARNEINLSDWKSLSFSAITENYDHKRIPLSKAERENLERKYDYYGASGVIDKVDRYLFDGKYLLIGEDGANLVTRSKPIAFIAEGQYWVNNHAHILSTKPDVVMEYLCYYINSISLLPYVTGSAQPKMTQAKMNSIPVTIPSFAEQNEIVCILDNLLKKQMQVREVAEQIISQIDTMKKAILARAFRGDLGTNDPMEESAEGMLKAVL